MMMEGNDSFSDKLKEGRVRPKAKTEESSSKELKEQNKSKGDRSVEDSDNATKETKFHVLSSESCENETGIPYNKVITRSMAKKQNAANKAKNDAGEGGNDRGNRQKRFKNENYETENEKRKQAFKEAAVNKNEKVKNQKASVEQVSSFAYKKGKSVKTKTSDKSNFSESNHEAIRKRNDKPIVKSEANRAKRTMKSRKCDEEEKKNSDQKKMISSSGSRGSNEKQAKKRKRKTNEDILSASSNRENEEESKRRKKSSSANKEMDENNYFHKLPIELVLHIFQYLSIKDLVNARDSYTYLKKVTENSIAWKGKVWRLTSNNREDYIYKEQLKNIPYVQIIEIINDLGVDKNVMKEVLLYVKDIQKLIATSLPVDSIIQVIQKYPNLESLSLKVDLEDSLCVLETLSCNCQKLRHLNFVLQRNFDSSEAINESYSFGYDDAILPEESCKRICELLEDSFPELHSVNLKYFQLVLTNEYVAAILEKRSHKLQNLGLCWYGSWNSDLIKIISRSAMKLDLTIFYNQREKFDLILLKDIKSVDINIFCSAESQFQFRDYFELSSNLSFSLPNVKTLELIDKTVFLQDFVALLLDSDSMKMIVDMFPKLNFLQLCPTENVNDLLSHLKCLQDLTVFSVSPYDDFPLSKEGISHMSQCPNLKRLKINFYQSYNYTGESYNDDDVLLSISTLQNLTHLELYECKCEEEVLVSFVCSVPNLKYLLLVDYINTRNPEQYIEKKNEVPLLAEECDKLKICLKLLSYIPNTLY